MRYLIFLLFGTGAFAETPMTTEEFEAYVTGKTLTFGSELNQYYGVEQYLPGRRVRWSIGDGNCTKGIWYPNDGNICFLYVNDPAPKCWAVFQTPDGLRAEIRSSLSGTVIFESKEDPIDMICGDLFS